MRGRLLGVVLCGLCLAGCASAGPDYSRPGLEAPKRWAEAPPEADAASKSGAGRVSGGQPWWESFGDPVLNGLVDRAVRNNLDLLQAQARVLQGRAALSAARAGYWPSVSAAASLDRSQGSKNTGSGDGPSSSSRTADLYDLGFDANWEIDLFGGTRRRVESARAGAEADAEDLNDTRLTLLGDVARNYIELRSAQEQLRITQDNAEAQRRTLEVTRERFRLGLATYLDVVRAEAQMTTTQADAPSLEASIKKSVHRLGVLLGEAPGDLAAELAGIRPLPDSGRLLDAGLPSELLARRPDLRRAERTLAAASADIGAATADLYPRFDLTAGLGLSSSRTSSLLDLASGYWSLLPRVSALLFDAGKTRANIEARRAVYQENLYAFRSAFLKALEEVENALAEYAAGRGRAAALAEAVRADTEAVALAEERCRRGLINFLDVLEAQRSLYASQSGLRKAEVQALTATVALYKALGGGWDAPGANVPLARAE